MSHTHRHRLRRLVVALVPMLGVLALLFAQQHHPATDDELGGERHAQVTPLCDPPVTPPAKGDDRGADDATAARAAALEAPVRSRVLARSLLGPGRASRARRVLAIAPKTSPPSRR